MALDELLGKQPQQRGLARSGVAEHEQVGVGASEIERHRRQVALTMKFDMGQSTLSTLVKQTQGSGDDLGQLIRQLVVAAAPLEGRFNGAGRAAFDSFKSRTDQITADLNGALAAIVGGQSGMDNAFGTGDTEMSDNARSTEAGADFSSARFGSR